MTRKRMIDPHIWEDPGFNSLSLQARLLFIGMISNADDYGYLRGDAGSLKRLIFGFDEVNRDNIQEWLNEISKLNSIHFFQVDGEVYAHFLKWDEYQKQREDRMQASVYPECDTCQTSDGQVVDKALTDVRQLPAKDKLSKDKLITSELSPSKKGLTPCTSKELNEISSDLDVSLKEVERTHQLILNKIKAGEFKNKTVYYTLKNWLIMGIQRGNINAAKDGYTHV